jgi:hypothetical protein
MESVWRLTPSVAHRRNRLRRNEITCDGKERASSRRNTSGGPHSVSGYADMLEERREEMLVQDAATFSW